MKKPEALPSARASKIVEFQPDTLDLNAALITRQAQRIAVQCRLPTSIAAVVAELAFGPSNAEASL